MEFAKGIKPLRGAEDWPQWKDRVMDVLELFNALDIVEGTREKPTLVKDATKADQDKYDAWVKSSTQAKIVISQCVSDELHARISGRLSAKEAWDILVQQFDNKAEDQVFRQCLNFFSMEWDENEDAPTALTRIRNQHRDFSAGIKTRNVDNVESLLDLLFVSKVLHILPKRLESFKSSYLLMKANNEKTIEDISSALILHERNVAPSLSGSSSDALMANAKFKTARQNSNQLSSFRFNDPTSTICKYCNEKGHWLKNCARWDADGKPPYPARATNTANVATNETEPKLAL